MNKINFFVLILLFLFLIASRLFPHTPNFVPVGAIFLIGGVYFSKKYFLLFLFGLFLSDYFLGFYDWRLMFSVYGSFLLIAYLGVYFRKNKSMINFLSLTVLSAVLFYLITNFAVWMFSDWYMHNINGLLMSYYLALPFFRFTLLSNIFYGIAIFSVLEFIYNYNISQVRINIFEILKNKLYNFNTNNLN